MSPSISSALIALFVLASTAAAAPAPMETPYADTPVVANFTSCQTDRAYCGWSLVTNLGWPADSIALQAIYDCADNGVEATHVTVCGKGCSGPSAHCEV